MISFARTTDLSAVKRVVTTPEVWRRMVDDYAPSREQWEPNAEQSIWYVEVFSDDFHELQIDRDVSQAEVGIISLFPQSPHWAEIHTTLLPVAWGRCVPIGKAFLAWCWENTPFTCLTTHIPSYNRLALRMAEQSGMHHAGLIHDSFKRGGKLHSQYILEAIKP